MKIHKEATMATYFIADTHFGHENVITYSHRPFVDVSEMDAALIENWNSRVTNNDDVYIIGDFCFKVSKEQAIRYAKSLKGRKHLIVGNHDKRYLKDAVFASQFVQIADILDLAINGERIILCHYPIAEWNGYFRGSWHIYGHIHNKQSNPAFAFLRTQERALNAGVEIIHYTPATFEELKMYNEVHRNLVNPNLTT